MANQDKPLSLIAQYIKSLESGEIDTTNGEPIMLNPNETVQCGFGCCNGKPRKYMCYSSFCVCAAH